MPLMEMLPCTGCGLRVQIGDMNYSLSGSRLLCLSCYEQEKGS